MKNNLPYFSHDNNARNHPKMQALIAEYGYEGYGRFWALNERIAESDGAFFDISKKVNKLALAKELNLDSAGLDNFLSFLADPEIDLINFEKGIITTDRINDLHAKAMESREEAKKRKEKKQKQESSPNFSENNSEKQESSPNFFRDKKREEEKREEETKQENSEDFSFSGFSESFQEKPTLPEKAGINEPPPENEKPPDKPAETKEDATTVFNKARN